MNGANQSGVDESGGWLTSRRFLLLLGAAILVAFPLVATGERTFFSRDFGALGYPGAVFFHDCLFRGELPLWNPYSHCGIPFLAQMGAWYPPAWLAFLLPLPWALNVAVLAHLFFGGAGMHRLARRRGAGGPAAMFAAFAFIFNGVTFSCLQWGNYIASLAWLPWVVMAVMDAWRGGGGRALAWAALASAMQVLTATPELTLLTWLFLGVLWLAEVLSGNAKFWPSAGRLALVVLLAAGITMVQMLPFYDLLRHSQRETGNAEAGLWAMPGWGWANFIVPLFHCYRGPEGNWFQTGQEFLQSYHPGVVVLALGLTAALLGRSRWTLTLAGTILFCWVMAMGSEGWLYGHVLKIFPLMGVARFPVKFAVLPAFLLPLLAAQGFEQIQRPDAAFARRLFAGIVGLLLMTGAGLVWFLGAFPYPNDSWNETALNALERGVILAMAAAVILFWNRAKSHSAKAVWLLLLPALLLVDAFRQSPELAPTLPAGVMAPGMWQEAGHPVVSLGQGRVMLSPAAERQLSYDRVADFQADFLGRRAAEWYNLNLLDGLPKVGGAFTLRPARFDFIERHLYGSGDSLPAEGLMDFLSVAWISSPTNVLAWTERTNCLPVITAGQSPRLADDDTTWKGISAANFNPRAEVYLLESQRALVTVSNRADAVVSNARFSDNRVEADVTASAPAMVVLSQVNYHCWQATVDGQAAPVLTANLAFQALQVPAGTHHIELVYRDPKMILGAVISLLALAAVALIFFGSKPKRGDAAAAPEKMDPGIAAPVPSGLPKWLGSRQARVMLLGLAAVISLPVFFSEKPSIGLDPSWHLSLQAATIQGKVFGRDFVFTYGPLGYLLIRAAVSKAMLLGCDLFMVGSLLVIYRTLLPPRLRLADALMLLALAEVTKLCWSSAPPAVLFTLLCGWLWRVWDRGDTVAVAASLIAALVLFFGKVNYGLITLFLLPGYGIGLLVLGGRKRQGVALLLGFPILICLGALVWRVDLPGYLRSGRELIAGYNEAMFLYPLGVRVHMLRLAGLFLLAMGGAAFIGRRRPWQGQIMLLPLLALAALLLFKNAFVRADWHHSPSFYAALPLLLAVWCIAWRETAVKFLLAAALLYSLAQLTVRPGDFNRPDPAQILPLDYCRQFLAAPWRQTLPQLQETLRDNHPECVFPDQIRATIGRSTVDVMPSQTSLAILNGLNYQPRPVPQSYSAYNRWLDGLNACYFASSNAPDFVVYAFDRDAGIDTRPLAWDESLTKAALLENYTFVSEFAQPMAWPDKGVLTSPFFLLKHQPHCRQLVPVATNQITVALGQWLPVSASTNLVLLTLNVERTIPGKLAAAALSPAMFIVGFKLADGRTMFDQAILPILKTGVLVNRRMESAEETRNWLEGDSAQNPPVSAVCFNTYRPWAFQAPFKGELVEYRLVETSR